VHVVEGPEADSVDPEEIIAEQELELALLRRSFILQFSSHDRHLPQISKHQFDV